MLRQQLRPNCGLQHCMPPTLQQINRLSRTFRAAPARQAPFRPLIPTTAAAAAAPAASPDAALAGRKGRPRKDAPRKKDVDEGEAEEQQPDLPVPMDYQQTLIKSFTIAGVGLHTGVYSCVRVRPAFAGEGRYFVRVPEGTNQERFLFEAGNITDKKTIEEAMEEEADDEELEDQRVEWFSVFLAAQQERGFEGSFRDFLSLQVDMGELQEDLMKRLLGLTDEDAGDDELPPGAGVEPDMSMEPEEIVPLDADDPTVVLAAITSVIDGATLYPCTVLGKGENCVVNTELLLAALEACGVDNARIEIEGGNEIPVLDNSALGWCIEVQMAGMRPAPMRFEDADEVPPEQLNVVQRDVLAPAKAIAVQDGEGWIAFFPGPFANITAGVDHSLVAPVIGCQWHTWHSDEEHFRYALAPARAYVESVHQLFALRDAGFVQAGAENLFLIADGDKWYDPDMVRMVYDEPVRYRLSQLVGNLSLLNIAGSQGIPVGHVTAFNATPGLQLLFVRALLEAVEEDDVVSVNEVLDAQEEWVQERCLPPVGSVSYGPTDLAEDLPEDEEEGEGGSGDDDDVIDAVAEPSDRAAGDEGEEAMEGEEEEGEDGEGGEEEEQPQRR